MKIRLTAALGLSAALLLSACAANEGTTTPDTTGSAAATTGESAASTLEGTLSGKGSSAVNSAQTTWIAKFQEANPGVTVNYAPDGSGAGREAFMGAGVDFAGSDRAFTLEENVAGASSLCADDLDRLQPADLRLADRRDLQRRGRHRPQPRSRHPGRHLQRLHHQVERPGHRRHQRGRRAPGHGHHARAPLGRLGHHRELHRLPQQDGPHGVDQRGRRRVDLRGRRGRQGHLRCGGRRHQRQRHHRLRRRLPGRLGSPSP